MYLGGNKLSESWFYLTTNFSETFLAKIFFYMVMLHAHIHVDL